MTKISYIIICDALNLLAGLADRFPGIAKGALEEEYILCVRGTLHAVPKEDLTDEENEDRKTSSLSMIWRKRLKLLRIH